MQGHILDHPASLNIKLNRDLYSRLISINFFKKIDLEIKHLFVTDIKKIISAAWKPAKLCNSINNIWSDESGRNEARNLFIDLIYND